MNNILLPWGRYPGLDKSLILSRKGYDINLHYAQIRKYYRGSQRRRCYELILYEFATNNFIRFRRNKSHSIDDLKLESDQILEKSGWRLLGDRELILV